MLPALWRWRFQVCLLDVSAMRKEADCKASAHTGLIVWVWHGYKMSYLYPYPYIPMGQTQAGIETHANHYQLYEFKSIKHW